MFQLLQLKSPQALFIKMIQRATFLIAIQALPLKTVQETAPLFALFQEQASKKVQF